MWKDYSRGYLKHNRAACVSIMVAVLIASLFLTFLCSLFYNMWTYDIQRIEYEEGDWHARLTGEIDEDALRRIEQADGVEAAGVRTLEDGDTQVDMRFTDMRGAYTRLPVLAAEAGVPDAAQSYHETLLSEYLIYAPGDPEPPLLLPFSIVVMLLMCVSTVLIIRGAFAVSMTARLHQLGILASVGATPRQIRACLIQEAAVLSAPSILLGGAAGLGLCALCMRLANGIGGASRAFPAVFRLHWLVLLAALIAVCLSVLVSAWLPARRMSRVPPLTAIRTGTEPLLKRRKRSPLLSLLFGAEGELAGNALKARKKALRLSNVSLTCAFLAFTMFLSFVSLSSISTQYTYFERYKDAWDVMATVRDAPLTALAEATDALKETDGVESCTAYQKATLYTAIGQTQISDEVEAVGGLAALSGGAARLENGRWIVQAPIVILDDASFLSYCSAAAAEERLDGAILLNTVWDSLHSNFRNRTYLPLVKDGTDVLPLYGEADGEALFDVAVLGYTTEPPALKEEYADYAAVMFLPASLWYGVAPAQIAAPDTYLRILTVDDGAIDGVEAAVHAQLAAFPAAETENRVRETQENDEILRGYTAAVTAFCVLLAVIGIANLFTGTLGFLYQRRREFARYLSVGVTPGGIRRVLWIEALTIAGRPLLITLPLAALFALFAVKASYLPLSVFFTALPVVPILLFALALFLCVGVAYGIGGKRLLSSDFAAALTDDTMA